MSNGFLHVGRAGCLAGGLSSRARCLKETGRFVVGGD